MVTALQLGLEESQMLAWGWRIPFLVAGPLGLLGLYMRMKLEETPAFQAYAEQAESREHDKPGWTELLRVLATTAEMRGAGAGLQRNGLHAADLHAQLSERHAWLPGKQRPVADHYCHADHDAAERGGWSL